MKTIMNCCICGDRTEKMYRWKRNGDVFYLCYDHKYETTPISQPIDDMKDLVKEAYEQDLLARNIAAADKVTRKWVIR